MIPLDILERAPRTAACYARRLAEAAERNGDPRAIQYRILQAMAEGAVEARIRRIRQRLADGARGAANGRGR